MSAPAWETPTYFRGDLVQSTMTFLNQLGNPADPTGITATVFPPGKAATTYTYGVSGVVRSSVGVYYVQVDTTSAIGNWVVRWVGTGTVAYAWEDLFIVYTYVQS